MASRLNIETIDDIEDVREVDGGRTGRGGLGGTSSARIAESRLDRDDDDEEIEVETITKRVKANRKVENDDDEFLKGLEEDAESEDEAAQRKRQTQRLASTASWDFAKAIDKMKKTQHASQALTTSLDEKIRRVVEKREGAKRKQVSTPATEDDDDNDETSSSSSSEEEEEDEITPVIPSLTANTTQRKSPASAPKVTSFTALSLSRPLLRALDALNFVSPTPIQGEVIPFALEGKDIMASAVTGSGKTAAYLLPILERLLYLDRNRSTPTSRVLILVPTRELAQQISSMLDKLIVFAKEITSCVVVGGLSLQNQSMELRSRPDIVIATPGRLIDHLRNTQSFDLGDVEVLVLDEADRLLELGFVEELKEICKFAPTNRQTMLFSATLSGEVKMLADLSLKNPVRVAPDPLFDVAQRLVQEFVRCRPLAPTSSSSTPSKREKEKKREEEDDDDDDDESEEDETNAKLRNKKKNRGKSNGNSANVNQDSMDPEEEEYLNRKRSILIYLCEKSAKERVMIFFPRKSEAHRMSIVFGLLGFRSAELHGNLTQVKRLEALQAFRDGKVDYLLCTDVAARGIDVPGVQWVINFDMPKDLTTYIHRVGRTARAGRGGRSITLVDEERRKTMRDLFKSASPATLATLQKRKIPDRAIHTNLGRLRDLEREVLEILEHERVEKEARVAMMEATKAENLILHADEIKSRPKRTWFQTEYEKTLARLKEFRGDETPTEREDDDDDSEEDDHNKRPVPHSKSKPSREEPSVKNPKRMDRRKRRRMEAKEEEAKRARAKIKELKAKAQEKGTTPSVEKIQRLSANPEFKQRAIAKDIKRKLLKQRKRDEEDGDEDHREEKKKRKFGNNKNDGGEADETSNHSIHRGKRALYSTTSSSSPSIPNVIDRRDERKTSRFGDALNREVREARTEKRKRAAGGSFHSKKKHKRR